MRDFAVVGLLTSLVLLGLFTAGVAAHPLAAAVSPSAAPALNLSISTTSSFSFVPNQVTVTPGVLVHLVVTQESNLAHSFVLSSVANVTIPSSDTSSQLSAFFNTNPPLVNLSLPGTVGAQVTKDFTAPPAGTYEFVCIVTGHFQNGMFGFLTSTTHPGAGSSSSGLPLSPVVLGGIVGLLAVVVVGVLLARRRSRSAPPKLPGGG